MAARNTRMQQATCWTASVWGRPIGWGLRQNWLGVHPALQRSTVYSGWVWEWSMTPRAGKPLRQADYSE